MTHLETVRARFARNEGLPFADVLTETNILNVLDEHGVKYRDRVFNPVTTLWGLIIAIPSLVFWSYYNKKVETLAIEMEMICERFLRCQYRDKVSA